jgi:hypothetical protein
MESKTQHELDMEAYNRYKEGRREKIKISFPTMSDNDIEKRIEGEWTNFNNKEKSLYYDLAQKQNL